MELQVVVTMIAVVMVVTVEDTTGDMVDTVEVEEVAADTTKDMDAEAADTAEEAMMIAVVVTVEDTVVEVTKNAEEDMEAEDTPGVQAADTTTDIVEVSIVRHVNFLESLKSSNCTPSNNSLLVVVLW